MRKSKLTGCCQQQNYQPHSGQTPPRLCWFPLGLRARFHAEISQTSLEMWKLCRLMSHTLHSCLFPRVLSQACLALCLARGGAWRRGSGTSQKSEKKKKNRNLTAPVALNWTKWKGRVKRSWQAVRLNGNNTGNKGDFDFRIKHV